MRATALITGGSRGIGRAVARRLASEGYGIVNLDLVAPDELLPGERHIAADLSDEAATAAALERALDGAEPGAPTCLVNNVGTVRPRRLEDTSLADIDAVYALNVRCAVQCAQALLPAMRGAKYGRIVNISSRAALGKELRTAYAASKAALIGLTRTWALELGRHGITVNAVAPGIVETELFRQANPPDDPRTERLLAGIPVGRLGGPDEVAHAVAFFLDERAWYVTGQTLFVCGGLSVGTVLPPPQVGES